MDEKLNGKYRRAGRLLTSRYGVTILNLNGKYKNAKVCRISITTRNLNGKIQD